MTTAAPLATADLLAARLAALPAVTLADLVDRAELQTRADRKYLVTVPALAAVLDRLAGHVAALQIDGRRVFGYSSVYFDTPDLVCFREHRQGRRRRFKVRTRTYVDSGASLLEVKAVSPRGQTVKHRQDHPTTHTDRLTEPARQFVTAVLDGHPAVPLLQPTAVTQYRRATLLDPVAGSRLTIDTSLRFTGGGRAICAPRDTVVIETKTAGPPGLADLALRRLGARPVSMSKYCIAVALLHPDLRANPWYRTLRRHFADGGSPGGPVLLGQ